MNTGKATNTGSAWVDSRGRSAGSQAPPSRFGRGAGGVGLRGRGAGGIGFLALLLLLLAGLPPAAGGNAAAGQAGPTGQVPSRVWGGQGGEGVAAGPPHPDSLVVSPPALAATLPVGDVATRTLTITNTGPAAVSVTLTPGIFDDFGGDSGRWTYYGSAYRDAANGYVVLTEAEIRQLGQLWLNQSVRTPITVEFRYRAGSDYGSLGENGFVLMFYKDVNYVPAREWWLGFHALPDGAPVPGYGIEFDSIANGWDPSRDHIALIKDSVANHLASVDDGRVEDGQWHHVRVEIGVDSVTVAVDGGQVLSWAGTLDRTFGGLGFSAATGAGWTTTNWHNIDDILVQGGVPWLAVSPARGEVPPGTSLLAEAHFDAAGIEPGRYAAPLLVLGDDPGPPLLSISVTMTATGVTFLPPVQAGQAARGHSATYIEQVRNLTDRADRFLLTTSGQAWTTTLSLTDTGPLADGAGITFTLQVDVPPGVPWYSMDTATVWATSVSSPTVYTDTAPFTTTAYAPPEITVSPAALTSTQEMRAVTTHTLAVANGHGMTLTFALEEGRTDGFGSDSGLWTYVGDAYRDTANGYAVLTTAQPGQIGQIWLDQEIVTPLAVEFRYRAGGGPGGDGFVLMFYKDRDYVPAGGGWLGFNALPDGDPVPGYGIEFDGYRNPECDPSGSHIALIQNTIANHLVSTDDARVQDDQWHSVRVEIGMRSVTVAVDGEQVLYWEGTLDRTFSGLGFAAANAGTTTDWHIIDDVTVSVPVPWLSYSPAAGEVATDASVPITVTLDAAALQPGAHRADILVHSDDPATPLVGVPVTTTVLPAAGMGWVEGTVTDAGSGAPLEASIIALGQPYTVTSDPDTGHYILWLDPGSYTLRAGAPDYFSQTVSGIVVVSGTGTTQDFSLTALPYHVISGTVTEAGTGLPLYASVTVHGVPLPPVVWTDPASGFYSLTLQYGRYTLVVRASGYAAQGRSVLADHDQTQAFTMALPQGTLLVDDDSNSPDVRASYVTALGRLGQAYDLWDTASWGDPTGEDLQGHETVLWFTGANREDTFTIADEAAVAGYLAKTWYPTTADNSSKGSSLVLDRAGYPHISYCHQGGDYAYCVALRYAYLDGTGWHTATVDSAGSGASLALDAAGYPHISYCRPGDEYDFCDALRYAYLDGMGWHTATVDSAGGTETSLALDTAGYPHISYCRPGYNNYCDALRYAYLDAAGWHTQTVDSAGGTETSLALDAAGYPHIAYCGLGGYFCVGLRYASLDAAGWHTETVDSAGSGGSLALDAAGRPHILYGWGVVRYAHYNGTDWISETLASSSCGLGWGTQVTPQALALDPTGRPHVTWLEWSCYGEGGGGLHYSYFDGSNWIGEGVEWAEPAAGGDLALDQTGSAYVSYGWGMGWYDLRFATRSTGHFFLSSEDYLHEMGLTAFGQDSLGIITYTDDVSQTDVVGTPGSPIGNGLGPYTLTLPLGWSALWTDAVSGTASPFRWQGTGRNNSTNYDTGHFQTAFLAWPLEGLADVDDRAEVLGAILDWFAPPCTPVDGADFSWSPLTPTVGLPVTFTGTVAWGSEPITYSWKLDVGIWKEGQVVTHTYDLPGLYTVTLTATNCASATATMVHTLTVQPPPCAPVEGADFSWTPVTPTVGQAVTFTATATGTLPITYSWKLEVGSWREGRVVTHTYDLPGTYTLILTATNCTSATATVTHTLTVAPIRGAHVVALLAFDNDLSAYAPEVLERFRLGTVAPPGLHATLLVDLKGADNTQVVLVAGGVVTATGSIPWAPGAHELDTAAPDTLAAFLTWARAQEPDLRTVVALLGHGTGPAPEVHLTDPWGIGSQLPPLPQFRDRTSGDVTSASYLSTPELGRALAQATGNGTNPFDLLFLDQCFGGSLDVLYEVRAAANVLVASPNYAWAAFAYDRYLPAFTAAAPAEAMAQAVVTEYEAALDDSHPNVLFWVRGSDLAALGSAASLLADALRAEALAGNRAPILAAAQESRYADTTLCAADLTLCPPDELLGLGSFARALQVQFSPGSAVYPLAGAVLGQLANVHGLYRIGHPWVKPEVTWAYSDTLTVLAPLTPTLDAVTAWHASIYTATAPLRAVWAPQPTRTVTITAPLAWTVDGAWDDFLAAWYGPLTPTVGLLCRALPPALEFVGPPSLTLVVTPRLIGADLSWTPHAPAHHYNLYVLRPDGTTWELLTAVPAGQIHYRHVEPLLPSGLYRYRIVARDAPGAVLAFSPEAGATLGITGLLPTWSYRGTGAAIALASPGFEPPFTVTLGGVVVAYEQTGPEEVIAVVPAGLGPGLYHVVAATPEGQTIRYDAFRVVEPAWRVYLPVVFR